MHLADQLVRVKLCRPKHYRCNKSVSRHQSQTITTHSRNMMFISIFTVIINIWQLLSTDDSYPPLSPLLSIKPSSLYQPARPLLSICRKLYSPIFPYCPTDQHMTPVNPTYCKLSGRRRYPFEMCTDVRNKRCNILALDAFRHLDSD